MEIAIESPRFTLQSEERTVLVELLLRNRANRPWRAGSLLLGWQVFDPETGMFIVEGEWLSLPPELAAREARAQKVQVVLPPERGHYHAYISFVDPADGWRYAKGEPFILVHAFVEHSRATLLEGGIVTLQALRRRNLRRAIGKFFVLPAQSLWQNRRLLESMIRRDVAARYRGSVGDVAWTILQPLLLMATYFFVFGVVLPSRFGPEGSRSGFVLYFLAGMLPWLPFSEAVGRAPNVIVDHRNFVKKLLFPVETLPVVGVFSGLCTGAFTLLLFLVALLLTRGAIPLTALWLPVLLGPQILLTAGLCWLLAALGVYFRDLAQIIGFLLTLLFFLTPICYAEGALPPEAAVILGKSPIYLLVRGFRDILLEGSAPAWQAMWKLWLVALAMFFAGHGIFHKLRKSFADVL